MSLNTILATTPLTSTNYVLKATGTTIGNSLIFDNGSALGVNTTTLDTSGGIYTGITIDSATYTRYSLQSSGVAKGRFQYDATNVSLGSQATGGKLQLFTSAAYAMEFLTNDTLRMTISSAGNVGIGTSSPETILHVNKSVSGGEGGYLYLDNPATSATGNKAGIKFATSTGGSFASIPTGEITNVIDNPADGASALTFGTFNGASSGERMRITSAGNVGIGTSTTSGKLTLYQGTAGNVLQSIVSNQGGSTRVGINFCPSMADSEAAISPAQASIYATDYNYSADIIFANKLTGAVGNALTERMRITSGGNVFIGYVNTGVTDTRMYISAIGTTSANFALVIKQSNNTQNLFYVRDDGFINTGLAAVSPYNNTSGAAANLVVTGAGGLERTVSSLKYKTDVKDYDKGLSEVLKMRPVYYKSINKREKDLQFAGLIAEEIHDLGLTEFVQYADDGTPDALAYQNMVALLTKAIQEINTKSEEQQALITSLQEQINNIVATK